MNTARTYSGITPSTTKPGINGVRDANRPGSVKKHKQQRKTNDTIAAKQAQLSDLVTKMEDRDTQQQAFTSLLEFLPTLDAALVGDLYARIEKNKNPGRSSTRRMFVLVLAALCKCHPATSARLLPRVMAYIALRLRDKETQVTDACAILCSAIALYVVPLACVNGKGALSPRRKQDNGKPQDSDGDVSGETSSKTFESLVSSLLKETNAVGEHATKCIAALLRPVEFDGSTTPAARVMACHGRQILPYLRVFVSALVAKMNESTQYASFSPTFVLLQAIVALGKVLASDCDISEVVDLVQPQLASLVDAIEDVFRDGPRDDWLLRKRAIELLIQLIDLFVLGETATAQDGSGRLFFEQNMERLRRLVMEARHDPVSAVRDAALPAVFQFDALLKLFPRTGEAAAPPSPFKRVYSARGGGGMPMNNFTVDRSRRQQPSQEFKTFEEPTHDAAQENGEELKGGDEDFGDVNGDEAATPHEEETTPEENDKDTKPTAIPALQLHIIPAVEETVAPSRRDVVRGGTSKWKKETSSRKTVRAVPRIASPKPARMDRETVPFQPMAEDEIAFPEEPGDEFDGQFDTSGTHDEANPPPAEESSTQGSRQVETIKMKKESKGSKEKEMTNDKEEPVIELSRAEAAVLAATEGEIDIALRLSFLEDDATLLKKVLVLCGQPCVISLSRATRTALCAAFLEFLEPRADEDDGGDDDVSDDAWLALVWLRDLSLHRRLVQQLDARVMRGLELRLNHLAELPSKAGLVAADILTNMGL